MEPGAVNELIIRARGNDRAARDELLAAFRPAAQTIASDVCKRPLDWNNDDELSIALMALNEAIDTYDPTRGSKFLSHARTVIHHRLVDYLRREARFRRELLPLPEDEHAAASLESRQAWDNYRQEEAARELEEMVARYATCLRQFGITLDDLVAVSPRHRDTRQELMRVARQMAREPALVQQLFIRRQLPIKELMLLTGKSRKVLESGRKYIIALVLILVQPEFKPIRQLIQFPPEDGDGRE